MADPADPGNVSLLVWLYVRLAKREERESLAAFGDLYVRYANNRPRFYPRFGGDNEAMGHL